MIRPSLIHFSAFLLLVSNAPAVVLAQWTFEVSSPTNAGPHTAELGEFATASFASTNSGGGISSPTGNGSPRSFSSNGWAEGEYFQFTTSTLGYSGITLEYAQAASGSGPRDFVVLYSLDGSNYVPFGAAYDGPDQEFSTATASLLNVKSFDFSAIPALNNNPTVGFRVAVSGTAGETSALAAGGTFRMDNVTISGVPEPGVTLLAAVGGLGMLLRRRR